jgi:hypothetical protein
MDGTGKQKMRVRRRFQPGTRFQVLPRLDLRLARSIATERRLVVRPSGQRVIHCSHAYDLIDTVYDTESYGLIDAYLSQNERALQEPRK